MGKRGLLLLLFCGSALAADPGPAGIWKVGDRYRFEFSVALDQFENRLGKKVDAPGWTLDEVYVDTILAVDAGRPTRVSRRYSKFELCKPGGKSLRFGPNDFSDSVVLEKGKTVWKVHRPAPKYAASIFKVRGSFCRWARFADGLKDTKKFPIDEKALGDLFPRFLVGRSKGRFESKNPNSQQRADGPVWTVGLKMGASFKPRLGGTLYAYNCEGAWVVAERSRRIVSLKLQGKPMYLVKKNDFYGKLTVFMSLDPLAKEK
ncbi:MAG: hypothetical protein V3T86_07730 [Planctomycetota bacterium]